MAKLHTLKDADGQVVCRINGNTRKGTYIIKDTSKQHTQVQTIELHGFDKLPSGFTKGGYGFTAGGAFLLDRLYRKFGKRLRIRVKESGVVALHRDAAAKIVRIDIPIEQLKSLNKKAREYTREKNDRIRTAVDRFLNTALPTEFTAPAQASTNYAPGTVATILADAQAEKAFSKDDRVALAGFYQKFLKSLALTVTTGASARFVLDSVQQGRTIFLKQVIAEYEKRLKQTTASESSWQTFLRDNILELLNSYTAVVEKQSVDLDGKYPDFMLIDPYGYLDIYEIKKPSTSLLRYDESRKNYYWDVEISKAIAQVERYIDGTREHHLEVAKKIKESSGKDIEVVRPRGFIIAGTRSQFESTPAARGFRILNDSLKNIDVILYDDILANVKALVERIGKDKASAKAAKKTAKKP